MYVHFIIFAGGEAAGRREGSVPVPALQKGVHCSVVRGSTREEGRLQPEESREAEADDDGPW